MRAFPAFAFLGLAAVVVGCNLIMNLGRFSEADAGVGPGLPDGGPFNCLGGPPETLDPGAVTLHLALGNATGTNESAGDIDGGSDIVPVIYTPVPGVTVLACGPLDPGCKAPVAGPQTTDDAGLVTFSLLGTFTGFFRATSPAIVPITFAPGQWLTGVKVATYETAALAQSDEESLNSVLNNAVDLDASSGLGEVFLTIYDCNDRHVAGATFTLNQVAANTLPFYLNSGLPSTKVQETDSEGVGGAVNVPHGTVHATATLLDASVTLGSIDVYVNAGELSYGWIRMHVH